MTRRTNRRAYGRSGRARMRPETGSPRARRGQPAPPIPLRAVHGGAGAGPRKGPSAARAGGRGVQGRPPRKIRRPPPFLRSLAGAAAILVLLGIIAIASAAVISTVQTGMELTRLPAVPVTGAPEGDLTFRPVQFPSREDGVRLRGWYIPAAAGEGSEKTVILIHDRGGNRLQEHLPAAELAAALVEAGYNVLLYDSRAHGNSGGGSHTLGMDEIRDVGGAVDFLKGMRADGGEAQPLSIAVLGHGIGGVTAIRAAARIYEIDAVIADSPFADLSEHVHRNIDQWTGLPALPFRLLTPRLLRSFTKVDFAAVSPVADVAGMAKPVMIIHGLDDRVVPHEDSLALARAAAGPADLWLVPGADHQEAFPLNKEEYVRRILAFLAGAAGAAGAAPGPSPLP